MVSFGDEHDFVNYPELTNAEIEVFGFTSPVQQIESDFRAVVVRVHDGDTVTLRVDFRDFDFPLRFASIDAPELNTGVPGEEARDYLKSLIEGEEVVVAVNRFNRVDKYGRLLGDVMIDNQSVGIILMNMGYAKPFESRREGDLPDLNKELNLKTWF